MTTIVIDGLNEEDFRRSIENRLREGRPSAAIDRLRGLLAAYCEPGGLLPERFLTVQAAELELTGWEALGEAISKIDLPDRPVTALSIAFGWPGDDAPSPDADGNLRPHLETSYFSDNAYPFSESLRDDLLEGYSFYGCTWSGDSEATDTILALEGIDDLHGALALLETRLLSSDEPDDDAIRAGSLGACLLSALLVQAVTDRVARDQLPRPLCVMAGSNGVYPYFDAPVVGMPAVVRKPAIVEVVPDNVVEVTFGAPAPRYSSLLMTGIPRAKKRAVLVLDESDDELASRIAKLRGLNHEDGETVEVQYEPIPEVTTLDEPFAMSAGGLNSPLLSKKSARHGKEGGGILGLGEPFLRRAEFEPQEWPEQQEGAQQTEGPGAPPPPPISLDEQLKPASYPVQPQSGADEPAISEEALIQPEETADQVPNRLEPDAEPKPVTAEREESLQAATPPDDPIVPGFRLLEPDLQQRLQMLLAGEILPPPPSLPAPAPSIQPVQFTPREPAWLKDVEPVQPLPAKANGKPRAKGIFASLGSLWRACTTGLGQLRRPAPKPKVRGRDPRRPL